MKHLSQNRYLNETSFERATISLQTNFPLGMCYTLHCNTNKKERKEKNAPYQLNIVKLRFLSSLYGIFKANVSVARQRQLQLTVCELLPGVDHQPVPPHIPTVHSQLLLQACCRLYVNTVPHDRVRTAVWFPSVIRLRLQMLQIAYMACCLCRGK